jgi:hypothetical protein
MKRIVSLASYTITSGLLRVTLTRGAARSWGAHLPEGTDTPAAIEYRRQARRILERKARDEGCVSVEIATAPYRGQSVTLDAFDLA